MKKADNTILRKYFDPIAAHIDRNDDALPGLRGYLNSRIKRGKRKIETFEIQRWLNPDPEHRTECSWLVGHLILNWWRLEKDKAMRARYKGKKAKHRRKKANA